MPVLVLAVVARFVVVVVQPVVAAAVFALVTEFGTGIETVAAVELAGLALVVVVLLAFVVVVAALVPVLVAVVVVADQPHVSAQA